MGTEQGRPRYRDGYFTVPDGLRLHYRDYRGSADRPPLLCLHGLTRNARDFAALAERCSPHRRVLVLEFRGRGMSDYDPLPARYNPLAYAADVLELLDGLMIDRAVFVGTSLGGLVMMTLAAMAPHRIAASILNDIGPEIAQAGLDRIQGITGKDLRFNSWEAAAAAIANDQRATFPKYGDEDWLAMARRNCREANGEIRFDYDMAVASVFATGKSRPTVDLWPLFARLAQKPLLVVRGALSELLSAEALEKMKEAAPNACFVTVPDVGHPPTLDEPEAAAAIEAFLASLGT